MSKNIEDIGIIFYVKKHKNNSLIVKILSRNNDIITGYTFDSSKNKSNFCKNQIGNYVNFCYSERNNSEIGTLSIDLIKSNSENFFYKKENIIILNSVVFFINFLTIENNNTNLLYKSFLNLIFSTKDDCNESIFLYYIDFLFHLLNYLGINLNPYICCVTNSKDTYYISPKTGNSVTKEVGEKYKNKLFVIPKCFKEFCIEKKDIINSLNIIYFFIEKFMYENNLFYVQNEFDFLKRTIINVVNGSNNM